MSELNARQQLTNLDFYFRVERDPQEVENAAQILGSLTEDAFKSVYERTRSHSITELVINLTSGRRYGFVEVTEETREIFGKLDLLQYA